MKAKVRVAIARREHSNADLATLYCTVNFIKQFVSRFHVLVVQERPQVESRKMVVKQRDNCSLCVYPSVVEEDITGFGNVFGQLDLVLMAEEIALEASG